MANGLYKPRDPKAKGDYIEDHSEMVNNIRIEEESGRKANVAHLSKSGEKTQGDRIELFLKGVDNNSRRFVDQMDRDIKCRKAQSCASVYRATSIISLAIAKKVKHRKKQRNPSQVNIVAAFHANKYNKVARESVGDNGIANCNKDRSKQVALDEAPRTWEFVKNIGVVALRNEEEIV
ncbi:hypothetical protein SLE2022_012980 [Rubroshorea leprosula]